MHAWTHARMDYLNSKFQLVPCAHRHSTITSFRARSFPDPTHARTVTPCFTHARMGTLLFTHARMGAAHARMGQTVPHPWARDSTSVNACGCSCTYRCLCGSATCTLARLFCSCTPEQSRKDGQARDAERRERFACALGKLAASPMRARVFCHARTGVLHKQPYAHGTS